jgi:SAM-dependent methyltransferase
MGNSRDLNYFYPTPESTGYDDQKYQRRFGILSPLEFSSVLDVGSGSCNLLKWLEQNKPAVTYEAMDIREDALALCPCKTHTKLPKKKFDLVCLYGTVTYNIGEDKAKNKQLLFDLLLDCKKIAKKLLIFTVMKEEGLMGLAKLQFVGYTRAELDELLSSVGLVANTIHTQVDLGEYVVICNINS